MSACDLFEKLQTFGAQIAPRLPGSWRLDRRPVDEDRLYCGVVILGPDHLALRLQDGERLGHKNRVHISGEIPDFGLGFQERRAAGIYSSSSGGINVSWHRTPQSIAADMTRRLMPGYVEAVAKAQQRVRQFKHRMETLGHVEQALRKVMPDLRDYSHNQFETQRRYSFPGEGEYTSHKLELSGYNGVHCDLELRDLNPDMSIRIMAMLREGRGGVI